MKLSYITSVKIPARDAQSVQIQSMSHAFYKQLGDHFLLISPRNSENKGMSTRWSWKRVRTIAQSRYFRYFFALLCSLPVVFRCKPDIIYTRDIGISFFYHLLGFQTVYEMHKPFETYIGNFLFAIVSKRSKVVVISKALEGYVILKYGVPNHNILAAHDGVDLDNYSDLSQEECRNFLLKKCSVDPNSFLILYSSNLYMGKGLEIIIEAAKKLPELYFVLLGRNDHIMNNVLPKNIIFLGHVEANEVPKYIKGSDCLIIPFTKQLKTWRYHSALKIFEYMASGRPIVSSNIGSLHEVLNEKNAFLFNPEHVEDFIEQLQEVKSNILEVEKRTTQASVDILQYTWDTRVSAIVAFVHK